MGATAVSSNRLVKLAIAAVLAVALVGGIGVVIAQTVFAPNRITAVLFKEIVIQ